MFKRSYALLALLVIAGMALAACGPAASAFECTDSIGCVTIGPGEPIHLAYAMVISGPDSTLGIDSRTGLEVAVAQKGQVLGHDIQLTGEDDGCSAEGGQSRRHKAGRGSNHRRGVRHLMFQRGACRRPAALAGWYGHHL